MGSREKTKKNPVLVFLKIVGIFLLSLLILLAGYFCYCALDRKKSVNYIPEGFSAVVSIDNLYKATNPLLDLKAADIYLSSQKNLESFLPYLYTARKSPLRKNPFVKLLLGRKVQASLYTTNPETADFAVVTDLGWLSGFTRPLPLVYPVLSKFGILQEKRDNLTIYSYKDEEAGFEIYFSALKNLVLVSMNKELLETAFSSENPKYNFSDKIVSLSKTDSNPVKIFLNARQLVSDLKAQNAEEEFYPVLENLVSKEELSVLTLDIKDSSMSLQALLPTDTDIEQEEYQKLLEILKTDIQVPSIISRLSSSVQYYTILNAAPFEKLKDALLPVLPNGKKYQELWKSSNDLTKSFLNNTLEELLFSWTGKEVCVFGLEGITSPVFALQIQNEEKRSQVFEKLSSSLIMRDDTSLILNGVRLPKLVFPDYIQNLLKAFGKNIKGVYYIVSNGFIYFSESPEPLSQVFNSSFTERISKNMNWKSVLPASNASMISLFYDLERSIPFFLKQKSVVSDILSLYSIGRFDVQLSDGTFRVTLNASGKRFALRSSIPGFPIELEGEAGGNLVFSSGNSKEKTVYWVENLKNIKGYNVQTGKKYSFECSGECSITQAVHSKLGGLWALTKNSEVYLFDEELNLKPNFPVYLDYKSSAEPAGSQEGLIIPLVNGNLCYVSPDASQEEVQLNLSGQIKSKPFVSGKTVLVYEKGFIGKIHKIEGKNYNSDSVLSISGVCYGSPVLYKKGKTEYISMITQNGNLYLWENGEVKSGFPLKLPGVFFSNVVHNGNYLFAISDTAELFRISNEGAFMSVKIPDAACREGFLSALKMNEKGNMNVFVSLDGNSLYGFNENLELLPFFPVSGWKNPVFTDVNGDSRSDIILLTADDKLAAWSVE